jgi:ribA/ribD-fused uncharacterized protein
MMYEAPSQMPVYHRETSIVFYKTQEAFGGLSNMAAGFPLTINGERILTSEALYQACKYPERPEAQRLILTQKSPMAAKMVGKPYWKWEREDWNTAREAITVREAVMDWCLRVKLYQHAERFGALLLATGSRPIVEQSRRDPFWGAVPEPDGSLRGWNRLGHLLMQLREECSAPAWQPPPLLPPLAIENFVLCGAVIGPVVTTGRMV